MLICISGKTYDVQDHKSGVTIRHEGRIINPWTLRYQDVRAEFRRITEDKAYAAREAETREA